MSPYLVDSYRSAFAWLTQNPVSGVGKTNQTDGTIAISEKQGRGAIYVWIHCLGLFNLYTLVMWGESKFIVQLSSYHYRHGQNLTNILQTLLPKANVLKHYQPLLIRHTISKCSVCKITPNIPSFIKLFGTKLIRAAGQSENFPSSY